jgi:CBS domain-containing protein
MATLLANSLRADRVGALRLREVCKAEPADPIEQVVRCMTERRSGCVLVHHGEDLVGIFTERDFVNRVVTQNLDCAGPVEAVMTHDPATVSIGDSVLGAIELMNAGGYRHLPVVGEHGHPVGVLSVKDIMHYLVQYFPAQVYNLPPTPAAYQPAREGA